MILILSIGRSGSSSIAEILHDYGISMGTRMDDTYEDEDYRDLNASFILGPNTNKGYIKIWKKQFNKIIKTKKEPYGIKDPGMAAYKNLLNEYLKLKPRIILSVRDKTDTINSFMRTYGYSRKKTLGIIDNRQKNLTAKLKGKDYLTVDCYDINKETKIKSWLGKS